MSCKESLLWCCRDSVGYTTTPSLLSPPSESHTRARHNWLITTKQEASRIKKINAIYDPIIKKQSVKITISTKLRFVIIYPVLRLPYLSHACCRCVLIELLLLVKTLNVCNWCIRIESWGDLGWLWGEEKIGRADNNWVCYIWLMHTFIQLLLIFFMTHWRISRPSLKGGAVISFQCLRDLN